MSAEVRVFRTPELLAEGIADAFVAAAHDAIAAHDVFNVALAGGTTPRAAYDLLASQPRCDRVDWARVRCYFGDERCVPPSDSESNYKTAQDALLARVPVLRENVYRMRGELPPVEAAIAYARILRNTLGAAPQLDLCMLGLGADAHTASLFPGNDPLTDDESLVRAVYAQSAQAAKWRLTITPEVINASREVLFGVSGQEKAEALHAVREASFDPCLRPAQIVRPHSGRLLWLVDAAAFGA